MCIEKFTTKTIKKTFRISLKHSNIHLTLFFFWQIFDFFVHTGILRASTSNATAIDSILHFFFVSHLECVTLLSIFYASKIAKNIKHMKKIKEMVFLSLSSYTLHNFFQPKCQKMCDGGKKYFIALKTAIFIIRTEL